MEINNADLLRFTAKKATTVNDESPKAEATIEINTTMGFIDKQYNEVAEDELNVDGKVVNIFGNVSDSELEAIYGSKSQIATLEINHRVFNEEGEPSVEPSTEPVTETSGTSETSGDTGTSGTTETSGETTPTPTPEESEVIETLYNYFHPKISFTNGYGFVDTDSLFEWLDKTYPGAKGNGYITKAQLTLLTKNDSREDANGDFFGVLNRAFSEVAPNDKITKAQINSLIMKAAGEDNSCTEKEFKERVLRYAAKVQREFVECANDQARMDFILKKTSEYLEAAKLTYQQQAMDRLLAGEDTYNQNAVKKGQIVFADFEENKNAGENDPITLGSYQPTLSGYYVDYNYISRKNNQTYWTMLWAGDDDLPDEKGDLQDGGLTLWIDYLDPNKHMWYEVVDTLVHELTHATAFLFYDVQKDATGKPIGVNPSKEGLEYMNKVGALTGDEYEKFSGFIAGTTELSDAELERLQYLMISMWGEYRAYQADADYVDSIGADVIEGESLFSTAVAGSQEKDKIISHVNQFYDNNSNPEDGEFTPRPDWDWWSFNNSYYA